MIAFDLKCALGHVFEVWFRSSADYETQADAAQIQCPFCGDTQISKAAMAPAVGAKGNQRAETTSAPAGRARQAMASGPNAADIDKLKTALAEIAKVQAEQIKDSRWVGDKFAEQARAMHYGEADHAAIHGTADPQEARAMIEEGVAVTPLLVPVRPPDETH